MSYWIGFLLFLLTGAHSLTAEHASSGYEAVEDGSDALQSLPSTADQIATLATGRDYLIGGILSPVSGQPCLRQTDLIVQALRIFS